MDSTPLIQTAIAAGLPTLSVLVGILINNARLTDLRAPKWTLDFRISKRS